MLKYALIFLASGMGGSLRYGLDGVIRGLLKPGSPFGTAEFPLGTLIVNVSGCLGIGFCAAAFSGPIQIRDEYRLAILIGLFGGYTTFSSFGRETVQLLNAGEWSRAGLYVLLSNGLGLFAVWLGTVAANRFLGTQSG